MRAILPSYLTLPDSISAGEISAGERTGTVADIRMVLAATLKGLATRLILAHNYPWENLKASQADLKLSQKFKEAGKLLDIQVLYQINY